MPAGLQGHTEIFKGALHEFSARMNLLELAKTRLAFNFVCLRDLVELKESFSVMTF